MLTNIPQWIDVFALVSFMLLMHEYVEYIEIDFFSLCLLLLASTSKSFKRTQTKHNIHTTDRIVSSMINQTLHSSST